ncbi:hypothetical protein ACLX1H_003364 [Fusarium chlamydosporum]
MSEKESIAKKSHSRVSSLWKRKTVTEEKHGPTSPAIQAAVPEYPAYIAEYQMKSSTQTPVSPPRQSQGLIAGKGNYRPYPVPVTPIPVPGSLISQIDEREAAAKTNSRKPPMVQNALLIQSPPSSVTTPGEVTMSSPLTETKVPNLKLENENIEGAILSSPAISRPSAISRISSPGRQNYEYTSLETGCIRLIRIAPGQSTTIECEMIQTFLDNTPEYVAISYTWGDVGDTKVIDIGGSRIPITVSLYGALDALRQKQSSVLVWADALCVDQNNTDERSQQVQLVPQICSNAAFVAIWLGPEENDSSRAVEFLSRLAPPTSQFISDEEVSRILADGATPGDLLATVSLFGRGYWRRVWTIQEIFNAKRVAVHCGSSFLPWQSYKTASTLFRRHYAELDFKSKGPDQRCPDKFTCVQTLIHEGPGRIPTLTHQMIQGENALLEVLRASRSQVSADPRDKLYGLLGVLPSHIRDGLRVDYNLSVKDVYTEIVKFLIQKTQKLDVICESVQFPAGTRSADLPSFVPDWSNVPFTSAMGHKYGFQASGSRKAVCQFLDDRLNKLVISGIEIDAIQTMGMVVGTRCNLGDFLMAFSHWRALLLAAVEGRTPLQIQLAEECLAATICLGQVPTG